MRTLSILLTAMATATAWAQPVIDVQNMPMLGDITTIGLCDDIVDAASLNAANGAMVTWDFSGLHESSEEQFTFVDPATTPWAADFPNSNLCGVSWENGHSYYIVDGTALRTEGNALVIPGTPPEDTAKILMASDPEQIIELPYTFGDGFTDNFSGTFQAGVFAGTLAGSIDQSVDGYGTLILPNATYTNVVRYHFNRVQVNTVLGNTSTQTKEQWAWVSPDHRFWLLLMEIKIWSGTTRTPRPPAPHPLPRRTISRSASIPTRYLSAPRSTSTHPAIWPERRSSSRMPPAASFAPMPTWAMRSRRTG